MGTALKEVTESFENFARVSAPYMDITTKKDYEITLNMIKNIMRHANENNLWPLLDLLAGAIEDYEDSDPEIQTFIKEAAAQPSDLSLLRLLMDQHQLGVNDFSKEIGSKSYVSMIMNGKRQLTRNHIEKLCKRFKISPALFF